MVKIPWSVWLFYSSRKQFVSWRLFRCPLISFAFSTLSRVRGKGMSELRSLKGITLLLYTQVKRYNQFTFIWRLDVVYDEFALQKNMAVPTCILQSRKVSYRNVSPWLSCNKQIARKTTTATTILLVENTAPSSVTTCFSLSKESFQMKIALGSKSTSFIVNDHCETTFLCRS